MPSLVLLIDFGSTFTKVTAVDRDRPAVVGRAQASTTINTDIAEGLHTALDLLARQTGRSDLLHAPRLASSSAAGGLRMIICGLVPRLTSEAGRRAALGAGAKVIGIYSYVLGASEIAEIERSRPDIVLLAGGTDGGDSNVALANARGLAKSALECPVVLAANKSIVDEAAAILSAGGKEARLADNVMPEFGRLNVDSVRRVIRDVFIKHIVKAKGLDKIALTLQQPVIPTPMAVLQAAEVLASGCVGEEGLGELMLVDVGGATTDVDSVARGNATDPTLLARGLPEPFAKRTVEGDLGIRFNAQHILESAGEQMLQAHSQVGGPMSSDIATGVAERVAVLRQKVDTVPVDDDDHWLDAALARTAVEIATSRHAGAIEQVHLADGDATLLRGKDLRDVGIVIGTGGIFAHGRMPRYVLEGARYSARDPLSLRPRDPKLLVDSQYIFYAMGLLASIAPAAAVQLLKNSLVGV
jgi:uncharacterized protein (TIGR01319 family)